jgi:predicted acetyltransferase
MSDVDLVPITPNEKPVLAALLQFYIYDFTEFTGEDLDGAGRFPHERLDDYVSDPARMPFLARVSGTWAGFALLHRREAVDGRGPVMDMEQFFVMRKHRRQRTGEKMAVMLFERFPGRWQVRERHDNLPAQQFWRTIIGRYAGSFDEIPADTSPTGGPVQYFTSPPSSGQIRRG